MKDLASSFEKQNNVELDSSYFTLINELDLLSYKLNSAGSIFKILQANPKGIYIYGLTGTGKTTLMNAFFESLKVAKLNIHFHDYFLDISRLLMKYTMEDLTHKIAAKIKVLCFDEFYIESIADAKLLEDLFERLIKLGVVIVLTSNFEPHDLFKGGFNRHLVFPKFGDFLYSHLHVFNLINKTDFREKFKTEGSIFEPNIPTDFAAQNLEINKHIIKGFVKDETAAFEYEELFQKPRSVNEYIFLCRKFDKIYIKGFKPFHKENEDELIRFRNFIDVSYQRHNIIKLEGAFSVDDVFPQEMLENIKIRRVYSRLLEIASPDFTSEENLKKRVWQKEARLFFENI